MDLRDFEGTTTYAIEAVYREYWNLIPDKYRISEKLQRWDYEDRYIDPTDTENAYNHNPKTSQKPLKYKDVKKHDDEYGNDDEYDRYMGALNDADQYFDVMPFYDPELNFDNRLHYKIVGIDYPKRSHPWFVITWNHGSGVLNSEITRRLFGSKVDKTPGGETVKFNFINANMDLTLAVYSNSMQGLMELQENILVNQREKQCVYTRKHSVLGEFPVSLNIISANTTKFSRDRGTLCMATLVLKMDWPVIGNVIFRPVGVIEKIHSDVKKIAIENEEPSQALVLSYDVIEENAEN